MKESTKNYKLHKLGERQYLTLNAFAAYPELVHLFTTRHGGVSGGCTASWNFGARTLDSEENIRQNYELLAETLGTGAESLVVSDQTHTTNIRVVQASDAGKGVTCPKDYEDVDGLVTDVPGIAIVTGHADCNAVFFYDPLKRVIGLVHSGWRGTLGGISREMVRKMKDCYGSSAENLITGLGPALCQDCFEVDTDVAQRFFDKDENYRNFSYQKGEKYYLDLKQIIRYDLLAEGILPEHFSDMNLCTKCHKDVFFSHRGHQGKRGIMAAAMMLR